MQFEEVLLFLLQEIDNVMWCNFSNTPDSASSSANAAFDLSSLGDGVRTSDLEDLKANAVKCLTDGFFKKLLDLEEVL